ncbi:MAG: rhomboid family intramembrane serine protease [Bacteroidetes bacterium]|nr:rhomboid family intramembrane serine protease [Bacteroidota bacterium]MDA1019183.1 rhomboid family intramembrane serine protease [Bacteroidota bacterium]
MKNIINYLIIFITCLISYKGFKDQYFFEKYKFQISSVQLGDKIRMWSSGFLHVDFSHLALNLFTLYVFSDVVIGTIGSTYYIIIYLSSLYFGNYFALKFHKSEPYYSAVGASGAVTGIVYSSILLYPQMKLALIFFPIPFPAYIFGIGYLLYSIYGMQKSLGNIGHTAHFGGAIAGLLITIIINPSILINETWIVILLVSPIVIFISSKKNLFKS